MVPDPLAVEAGAQAAPISQRVRDFNTCSFARALRMPQLLLRRPLFR